MNKKTSLIMLPTSNGTQGFAMLFTVLIVSLILIIALGISNVTFKQTILSRLAKDSQIAFYQADGGIECGMYYSVNTTNFSAGATPSTVPQSISCEGLSYWLQSDSYTDYFIYGSTKSGQGRPITPCKEIIFDKATEAGVSKVVGKGYNVCLPSTRQVERTLEVRF